MFFSEILPELTSAEPKIVNIVQCNVHRITNLHKKLLFVDGPQNSCKIIKDKEGFLFKNFYFKVGPKIKKLESKKIK
jgi:hypothetical protein